MFKFVQLNIVCIDKKRDRKEKKEKEGEKQADREKDRKDIIGGRGNGGRGENDEV